MVLLLEGADMCGATAKSGGLEDITSLMENAKYLSDPVIYTVERPKRTPFDM